MERAPDDHGLVITTYEGTHNHLSPAAAAANASSRAAENSSSAPPSEDHRSSAANFPFQPIPERSQFDLTMQLQEKNIEARQDSATATTSRGLSQSPPRGLHIPDSLSRDQPRLSVGGALHGDLQLGNGQLTELLLRELQGPLAGPMVGSVGLIRPDPHLGRAQEIHSFAGQDLSLPNGTTYFDSVDEIFRQDHL